MENNKIALFQEKEIRRVWHKEEWWFAINDVIQALTNTPKRRGGTNCPTPFHTNRRG